MLAAGQGYVSWFAQFRFIYAAKHAVLASGIEALGLDTGAVIFALLALALVRLERRAIVPRILNVSCASGSLAMNVLASDLHSVRSVVIYALPSALYATASDQLIAVVRRHALPAKVDEEEQRSAWAMAWRADGQGRLRCRAADRLGAAGAAVPAAAGRRTGDTFGGLRLLVLVLTPLPEAEHAPAQLDDKRRRLRGRRQRRPQAPAPAAAQGRAGRRADQEVGAAEALYAGHAGYGDRAQVTAVAKAIAPGPASARAPPGPTSTACSTTPRPGTWTRSGASFSKAVPHDSAESPHQSR